MACNVLLDGMDELPDLARLSVAEKDELIRELMAQVGALGEGPGTGSTAFEE